MKAYKQQRTLYRSNEMNERFERITNVEVNKRSYYSFGSRDKLNKASWLVDYDSSDEYDWFISYSTRFEVYRQKKD